MVIHSLAIRTFTKEQMEKEGIQKIKIIEVQSEIKIFNNSDLIEFKQIAEQMRLDFEKALDLLKQDQYVQATILFERTLISMNDVYRKSSELLKKWNAVCDDSVRYC